MKWTTILSNRVICTRVQKARNSTAKLCMCENGQWSSIIYHANPIGAQAVLADVEIASTAAGVGNVGTKKCRQGRVCYGLIKPGTKFCSRDPCTYHNLFNLCMTKGYPKNVVAFGNHGNEWRASVINGCWNLKMKKRAEVDRLASQSLGGARSGASHPLLSVIVCCANIASFGDYFMYFRLVLRWSSPSFGGAIVRS